MCRTCGCGDVDEYDDDLAELAEDDAAWHMRSPARMICRSPRMTGVGRSRKSGKNRTPTKTQTMSQTTAMTGSWGDRWGADCGRGRMRLRARSGEKRARCTSPLWSLHDRG
jgi:hypothetical protein